MNAMNRSFSSSRLRLLAQAPLSLVQARCGPITLTMRIPLRRGSCPSLALSVWQMRLADGTVAIPPILIGTHASRIREIGAPALAAATINSSSLN